MTFLISGVLSYLIKSGKNLFFIYLFCLMKIILGTLNFDYDYVSQSFNQTKIDQFLATSHSLGIDTIDSAYYYGNAERYLGNSPFIDLFKVNSKANPWFDNDFSNGKFGQLNRLGIEHQLTTSLNCLGFNAFDTYFMHCWDYETPIEETVAAFDHFYRQEKFSHFGVSNISPVQLQTIIDLVESEKYNVNIDVYQGMYNLYCRKVEELFPTFNDYNIQFQCYNPLAGGLLTGKYTVNKDKPHPPGRFCDNPIYQSIFWNDEVVQRSSLLNADLALRWLRNNSLLRYDDAVIIGCSTLDHLRKNVESLRSRDFTSDDILITDSFYKETHTFQPNYFY
jgi:aflatoxin B1 aldehyde reductase